jgi:hypothetical protein
VVLDGAERERVENGVINFGAIEKDGREEESNC